MKGKGGRFNISNCYYQIVSVQNGLSKLYCIFCGVFLLGEMKINSIPLSKIFGIVIFVLYSVLFLSFSLIV